MAKRRRDIVNENIKNELKRQGKSHSWLSAKLGLDRSIVTNCLNRSAKVIDFDFLEKVAEVLNVDVTYLLGFKNEEDYGHQTYKDLVKIVSKDLSPYERMRDAMIVNALQGIDEHLTSITDAIYTQSRMLELLIKERK